jgi:hypothetical protein
LGTEDVCLTITAMGMLSLHRSETSARNLEWEQAARLAAILPAPLKQRPARMNQYSALIKQRMRQMSPATGPSTQGVMMKKRMV